jgi:2-keto-4-pentenoate hydratase/2-oxohepta-3-ene-1,7-dioic acid hydratase in catechol pathway
MEGNAWNMHHTLGAMLERASQDSRIVAGDVVEMEVEGIGVLRNTLGPTTNPHPNLRFTAPIQRPLPEPLSPDALRTVRERTAAPR